MKRALLTPYGNPGSLLYIIAALRALTSSLPAVSGGKGGLQFAQPIHAGNDDGWQVGWCGLGGDLLGPPHLLLYTVSAACRVPRVCVAVVYGVHLYGYCRYSRLIATLGTHFRVPAYYTKEGA